VFASLIDIAGNVGLPVLALLIAGESMGVPLPGETALISMGIVASQGKLPIEAVIAVAAAAAIIGDNIGFFFIGRKGGRRLLERPGLFEKERRRALEIGDPFFERHGPKAVFFGRWIAGLRTWASWLAGASNMHWRTFLLWNALGGILWATTVGLAAYYAGSGAKTVITQVGSYALIAVGVLVVALVAFLIVRRRRQGARRRNQETSDQEAS
jgi:membrane protein DedA with SNARE-associated domain